MQTMHVCAASWVARVKVMFPKNHLVYMNARPQGFFLFSMKITITTFQLLLTIKLPHQSHSIKQRNYQHPTNHSSRQQYFSSQKIRLSPNHTTISTNIKMGCGIFSRKSIAGIPTGAEHAPRKVSTRSTRTSMSASRGRLSTSTPGAHSNNQSRSRGPNGEFRGSVGGLRNGPPVLQ